MTLRDISTLHTRELRILRASSREVHFKTLECGNEQPYEITLEVKENYGEEEAEPRLA